MVETWRTCTPLKPRRDQTATGGLFFQGALPCHKEKSLNLSQVMLKIQRRTASRKEESRPLADPDQEAADAVPLIHCTSGWHRLP